MSWRTVVVGHNAKLDYQMGYLVVRSHGVLRISIKEIGLLIIESTAVSLTSYLLNELMKEKVKVIFCDEKRNPSSELVSYYGSHNTSRKIREQVLWSKEIKEKCWTKIVQEKIIKQRDVLKYRHKQESELLDKYLGELLPNDASNREGHAAKVYFNALFGPDFSRHDILPVNSALNYGYSLLLSGFNREIVGNGYLTQLGLFHDNQFNPFNLSSDLMEPFRPLVDRIVVDMQPEFFSTEEKHRMLELWNQEVIINQKKEILPNAIKFYVKSILSALQENDISLMRFYEFVQ